MAVKNRLKFIRHKRQLKQMEFAQFLGVQYATYNTYETQRRQPSLEVALQFAQRLDCIVNDIFYLEENDEEAKYEVIDELCTYKGVPFDCDKPPNEVIDRMRQTALNEIEKRKVLQKANLQKG